MTGPNCPCAAGQSPRTASIELLDQEIEKTRSDLQGEIGGEVRDGLSGRAGDGPNAEYLRTQITDLQGQRDAAAGQLTALDATLTAVRQADEHNAAVHARIAELRDIREQDLSRPPGLAVRIDALADLMAESTTILVARIVLTLFLLGIDAAPAIVRITSSGGAYDRIRALRIAGRIEREREMHKVATKVQRTRIKSFGRTEQAQIAHDEATVKTWLGWNDDKAEDEQRLAPEEAAPADLRDDEDRPPASRSTAATSNGSTP